MTFPHFFERSQHFSNDSYPHLIEHPVLDYVDAVKNTLAAIT